MSEEVLFVRCEMWVEKGDDGKPQSVRYSYRLPDIENELIADLYEMFLESLCAEIAQLAGAEKLLSILGGGNEEDRDNC